MRVRQKQMGSAVVRSLGPFFRMVNECTLRDALRLRSVGRWLQISRRMGLRRPLQPAALCARGPVKAERPESERVFQQEMLFRYGVTAHYAYSLFIRQRDKVCSRLGDDDAFCRFFFNVCLQLDDAASS